MARVPLYRDAKTTKSAAVLKAGQNGTLTEAEVGKLAADVAREAAAKAEHITAALAEPVTR